MTIKPSVKHTFRLSADLSRQLADHARAKRVTKVAVIEAALGSFLSPDGADRLEAALARRLDRMGRQMGRIEWNVGLSNELTGLFIRSWSMTAPEVPATARAAAMAKSAERWEEFVVAVMRRMEGGSRLARELSHDIDGTDDPT